MHKRNIVFASLSLAGALLTGALLAACGGGSDSSDPAENTSPTTQVSTSTTSTTAPDAPPTTEAVVIPTPGGDELPPAPSEEGGGLGATLGQLDEVVEGILNSSETPTLAEPDIRVVIQNGAMTEGQTRYEVALGTDIIIEVVSDLFDRQVHVHGYDLYADAGPITPARFEFNADMPGVWEVEFEEENELIFELAVS